MTLTSVPMPAGTADTRTEATLIASYDDYGEAQRAVDRLAEAQFPVERLRVIGWVDDVRSRRTLRRAAGDGALNGALVAGFVGLLFGLFNWLDPVISPLALGVLGLAFGAALGALFGLVAQVSADSEHDAVRSQRYDLLGDAELADRARECV